MGGRVAIEYHHLQACNESRSFPSRFSSCFRRVSPFLCRSRPGPAANQVKAEFGMPFRPKASITTGSTQCFQQTSGRDISGRCQPDRLLRFRFRYCGAQIRHGPDEMKSVGTDVRIDAAGNIFASRRGTESSLPPLLFGSHIDSVPQKTFLGSSLFYVGNGMGNLPAIKSDSWPFSPVTADLDPCSQLARRGCSV